MNCSYALWVGCCVFLESQHGSPVAHETRDLLYYWQLEEMLRIVTWATLWSLPKHVIPLSKLVCGNLCKKHWLPETLVNLEILLWLFMIVALAGAIASLLVLNMQHYLPLSLDVDRCAQALLLLSYWVFWRKEHVVPTSAFSLVTLYIDRTKKEYKYSDLLIMWINLKGIYKMHFALWL